MVKALNSLGESLRALVKRFMAGELSRVEVEAEGKRLILEECAVNEKRDSEAMHRAAGIPEPVSLNGHSRYKLDKQVESYIVKLPAILDDAEKLRKQKPL